MTLCNFIIANCTGWTYSILAYLSFIQHKSYEIICSLGISYWSRFDTKINYKDPGLGSMVQIIWDEFTTNLGIGIQVSMLDGWDGHLHAIIPLTLLTKWTNYWFDWMAILSIKLGVVPTLGPLTLSRQPLFVCFLLGHLYLCGLVWLQEWMQKRLDCVFQIW